MRRIIPLVITLLCITPAASGATRTWSATPVNGNWSNAANWNGGVPPTAGDSVVFPASSTTLATLNDLAAGTNIASIQFDGTGYSVGGNSIALGTAGITCGPALNGTVTLTNDITLAAATTIDVQSSLCFVAISGVVSGAGGITKTGPGLFDVGGVNTYTGITTIDDGYIRVFHAAGLGAGDGTPSTGTVVNPGGTLNISGVTIANEAVTVHGQGYSNNGVLQAGGVTSVLGGPLVLGDNLVQIAANAPNELVLSGVVSGSGRFQISGNGTVTISNPGNSFTNPITWGGSTKLKLGASNVVPDGLGFTLGGGGSNEVDLNGFEETVSILTGAGRVRLTGASVLTVVENGSSSYTGGLIGPGTYVKSGTGTITLPFSMPFMDGVVRAAQGTLLIGGTIPGLGEATGGTLGGTGTITKGISATGGTVAPGTSPGILTSGPVSFDSSSTFSVELNGTTPGTQHDQLQVTGTVSLGSAVLNVTLGYDWMPGDQYVIIANDGTDPVTGTFAGLPEGGVLSAGGGTFRVSYVGGDGNDVTLTALTVPVPVPTLDTWALLALLTLAGAVAAWRLR